MEPKKKEPGVVPLPHFRVRAIDWARRELLEGQTLVLGTRLAEDVIYSQGLASKMNQSPAKKAVLVFITPRIISATGDQER
jgi:hypothetical protein